MRALFAWTSLAPLTALAQVLNPTVTTPLDGSLNETSGLVVVNNEVWTQLDSGNPNNLYRINPVNGAVLRTVTVTNATNSDWEDITVDEEWLYIGDFGNNGGSRTDLRVYRVPLEELLEPSTTEILADTIRFAYALQTDFTPAAYENDWDCEAMIAVDDSIFLFSKNWVTNWTYLYALPAIPGDHLAERRDTLDAQGLVTGASYDPATGAIALVGYSDGLYMPFVWRLASYTGHEFFNGITQRNNLSSGITQMEAIAWAGTSVVYMTNEQSILNGPRLWELGLDLPTSMDARPASSLRIRPSPSDGRFIVSVSEPCLLEIRNANGQRQWVERLSSGDTVVEARDLPSGVYMARTLPDGSVMRIVIAH